MGRKRCIIPLPFPLSRRGKAVAAGLLAAAFLLAGGILIFRRDSLPQANPVLRAAAAGLSAYDVTLRLIPDEQSLAISETVTYRNDTGETLDSLILRTWLNAFQTEETSPAALEELYDACYPTGFSPGFLTLYNVMWNGEAAADEFVNDDQTALRIAIPSLASGESGTLFLRCVAKIPSCAYRTGYADGCWQLGNVLPLLSVYQDGEWRTDAYAPIGDPFVSECANFHISLTVPDGYVPACAAPLQKDKDGIWRGELLAARDMALCVYEHAAAAKGKVGGTSVYSYAATDSEARRALEDAKKALATFSSLYGGYPYPALTLCQVSFPFGGMEYPALCMLGKDQYLPDQADSLELTVAHETAHQWFCVLVGSDGVNQPWQDEALSEYGMLKYVQKRYGQSSFETLKYYRVDAAMTENIPGGLTPGSPIAYFSDYADYRAVVYGRGAAMLISLDEFLSKGTDDFLRAYVNAFSFQIASRDELESFLNQYTGLDARPLLLDYLDTKMD